MKKIYCFEALNNTTAITIDETQNDNHMVTLKVCQEDNILILQFDRDDFDELCNMRFRLDFPVIPAQLQELALVA